jgi:hypothetical protein
VTVRWSTNLACAGYVQYGEDPAEMLKYSHDVPPGMPQTVTLSGLDEGTWYYRIVVTRNGVTARSDVSTFETPGR